MQVNIPGYQIKKVLGKGGMATVYLAVQEIFEREVALKVMSSALAEDPSFGQRFMREARIVSQLVHPHIITVFDVGVHQDFYYLSMEYIPGPDLKQACAELSLQEKLAVIEDVARALDFAGNKGYVHRDIKPENILLRSANGNAVLMDFGIARAAATDLSVTQTGTSLGTPHYMSPEQAKGHGVDHRSDLYSLGVVFYYLLMQNVPYKADSAVAIGIKHITEPVPVLPGYLQMLNPFVARLMAKEPEYRYQHAADFIADLQRLDHKKLLKQYASKSKYYTVIEETAAAEPTMLHDAATRIERAVNFAAADSSGESAAAAPRDKRRRKVVAAVVSIFLLVCSAGVVMRQASVDGDASANALPGADHSTAEAHPTAELARSEPGFANFTSRFGLQKHDVDQQVQRLRAQLSSGAQPSEARAKLDRLAQRQLDHLRELFERADYEQAQTEIKQLTRLFPEQGEQLSSYHQRLPTKELLATYAQKAQQRMDKQQYLQPEGDSAEHYYMAMLELSPNEVSAHNGLVEMAKRTIAKANQDFVEGDWRAAQEVVDRLLALDPNHIASLKLQKKIERYKQNESTIEQHLTRGRGHLSAGNLYTPEGDNAYLQFKQVLALHKGHRAALEGLEQVHQALEKTLFAMVKAGQITAAQETLVMVRRVRGQDARLKQLEAELATRLSKLSEPSPSVKRIVVAAQPLSEMSTQTSGGLAIDRTVYIGMEYQAFADTGAIVQAVLYGPEGQAEANVPVNVERSEGAQFFEIDRPRKAFDKGRYQLKLVMQGETLGETDFRIN